MFRCMKMLQRHKSFCYVAKKKPPKTTIHCCVKDLWKCDTLVPKNVDTDRTLCNKYGSLLYTFCMCCIHMCVCMCIYLVAGQMSFASTIVAPPLSQTNRLKTNKNLRSLKSAQNKKKGFLVDFLPLYPLSLGTIKNITFQRSKRTIPIPFPHRWLSRSCCVVEKWTVGTTTTTKFENLIGKQAGSQPLHS
jgi:hypothetical protein